MGVRRKQIIRRSILVFILLVIAAPFGARLWIHLAACRWIYCDPGKAPDCPVAIVLGAKVINGNLCRDLDDRVCKAVSLYKVGKVEKILMSGDNRFSHYNEPERMRERAIALGVAPDDVKGDYAGRRTWDTAYRAKHIFGIRKCIVVSQGYHLDRAVFLLRRVGVDAYGVPGDNPGSIRARIREFPACMGTLFDAYIRHPRPVLGKKEKL